MKIKLYTLKELKQMNAPYIERKFVCGIRKRDYKKLSKRPQKVVYHNDVSYCVENSPYIILHEYLKEIDNED